MPEFETNTIEETEPENEIFQESSSLSEQLNNPREYSEVQQEKLIQEINLRIETESKEQEKQQKLEDSFENGLATLANSYENLKEKNNAEFKVLKTSDDRYFFWSKDGWQEDKTGNPAIMKSMEECGSYIHHDMQGKGGAVEVIKDVEKTNEGTVFIIASRNYEGEKISRKTEGDHETWEEPTEELKELLSDLPTEVRDVEQKIISPLPLYEIAKAHGASFVSSELDAQSQQDNETVSQLDNEEVALFSQVSPPEIVSPIQQESSINIEQSYSFPQIELNSNASPLNIVERASQPFVEFTPSTQDHKEPQSSETATAQVQEINEKTIQPSEKIIRELVVEISNVSPVVTQPAVPSLTFEQHQEPIIQVDISKSQSEPIYEVDSSGITENGTVSPEPTLSPTGNEPATEYMPPSSEEKITTNPELSPEQPTTPDNSPIDGLPQQFSESGPGKQEHIETKSPIESPYHTTSSPEVIIAIKEAMLAIGTIEIHASQTEAITWGEQSIVAMVEPALQESIKKMVEHIQAGEHDTEHAITPVIGERPLDSALIVQKNGETVTLTLFESDVAVTLETPTNEQVIIEEPAQATIEPIQITLQENSTETPRTEEILTGGLRTREEEILQRREAIQPAGEEGSEEEANTAPGNQSTNRSTSFSPATVSPTTPPTTSTRTTTQTVTTQAV